MAVVVVEVVPSGVVGLVLLSSRRTLAPLCGSFGRILAELLAIFSIFTLGRCLILYIYIYIDYVCKIDEIRMR